MPTLSPEHIRETWLALQADGGLGWATAHDALRRQQPILAGFLRAATDSVPAGPAAADLDQLGLWAWECFRRAGHATAEITAARIDAAFDHNVAELAALEAHGDAHFLPAARSLTRAYPQMPLLGALMEHLFGRADTAGPIDDAAGLLTLYLKTIIDVLDTAE
jgi:hypothetical protein